MDVEVRLIALGHDEDVIQVVLLGSGDYRTDTDQRPAPPRLNPGDRLDFGPDLHAIVLHVDDASPRLVTLRWSRSGASLYAALYRHGRPIQYAHVPQPLEIWDVQNLFASRPWAFEVPSAGLHLDGDLLLRLQHKGIHLGWLTHAAGVSATGSPQLDRRLPLPERYEIPERTVQRIDAARERGHRIIAVGTTVVRALESSAAEWGRVNAGIGEARIVLGPGYQAHTVDGILTGMHEPGTSHFSLLQAFAPRELLLRTIADSSRRGYLTHEFGDCCLITK